MNISWLYTNEIDRHIRCDRIPAVSIQGNNIRTILLKRKKNRRKSIDGIFMVVIEVVECEVSNVS